MNVCVAFQLCVTAIVFATSFNTAYVLMVSRMLVKLLFTCDATAVVPAENELRDGTIGITQSPGRGLR